MQLDVVGLLETDLHVGHDERWNTRVLLMSCSERYLEIVTCEYVASFAYALI